MLTVASLIALLEKLPPDMPVVVNDGGHDGEAAAATDIDIIASDHPLNGARDVPRATAYVEIV